MLGACATAAGAMYAFFKVDGMTDSLAFCKRLVAEQGWAWRLVLPFGDEEKVLRWCFASDLKRLTTTASRGSSRACNRCDSDIARVTDRRRGGGSSDRPIRKVTNYCQSII